MRDEIATEKTVQVERLRSQVVALEQLLEVHEQAVLEQSERLERTLERLGERTHLLEEEITERKEAEESLRQSETRYRSLVQGATYGICRSTPEGRFLEVNPALVAMLGYDSDAELLGVDIARNIYQDPGDAAQLREQLDQNRLERAEVLWKRKDGRQITVALSGRLVNEPGGSGSFEFIVEDVTQRRALEQQFRQAQKMEAVGRLAGGVAHDFNNLLTVITGYAGLLLENVGPNDPMSRDLKDIKNAADRAASLTRQLLAFSRRQVLQPTVLNLNGVVADSEKILRRVIGEDIDLLTELDPALGRVKADAGQIEQVIMNLAVNSRDAMPEGGKLTIETTNVDLDEDYCRRHVAIEPAPYVMLSVSYDGCGMDEETRSRVFEPFFTTKERDKGTGLGLATVYGIVKQSGGFIWVYSEPGQGATFKVYLPRVEESAERVEPPRAPREAFVGSETILLVEDEEAVRTLTRRVLQKCGYTVLAARNGGEALLLCEQHERPIHLMLTDVVMPQMSGRELAERLAPLRPEMKVLYMSGYTDNSIVHHGVLDAGASFLQKPFARDGLARKVREVLDARPHD